MLLHVHRHMFSNLTKLSGKSCRSLSQAMVLASEPAEALVDMRSARVLPAPRTPEPELSELSSDRRGRFGAADFCCAAVLRCCRFGAQVLRYPAQFHRTAPCLSRRRGPGALLQPGHKGIVWHRGIGRRHRASARASATGGSSRGAPEERVASWLRGSYGGSHPRSVRLISFT